MSTGTGIARLRAMARAGVDAPRDRDAAAGGAAAVAAAQERCDICHTTVPDDHRHLLHLEQRSIVCACEACWALHSGDAEYRPTGMRTLSLPDFRCDDDTWASLSIPIGLAFFMRSTVTEGVLAFYPSPAGATESEVARDAWEALQRVNPVLGRLDADGEALVANRLVDGGHEYMILPIDRCYELVGLVRMHWEGISGRDVLEQVVPEFFARMRARAATLPAGAGVTR